MKDCRSAIKNLLEYLDRELCVTDSAELQKHLDACRPCYDRMQFEQLLREQARLKTFHKCPDKVKRHIEDIIKKF